MEGKQGVRGDEEGTCSQTRDRQSCLHHQQEREKDGVGAFCSLVWCSANGLHSSCVPAILENALIHLLQACPVSPYGTLATIFHFYGLTDVKYAGSVRWFLILSSCKLHTRPAKSDVLRLHASGESYCHLYTVPSSYMPSRPFSAVSSTRSCLTLLPRDLSMKFVNDHRKPTHGRHSWVRTSSWNCLGTH